MNNKKWYRVQIVKHCIIERTIEARNEDEAEEIANERYKNYDFSSSAYQITCDVKYETENFWKKWGKSLLKNNGGDHGKNYYSY